MFSFLSTLKNYHRSYFGQDLLAGLMVAALTIPVAMGYAELAGLPPIYGLYTSLLAPIGYAFFASSRQLIFGIDSGASAVTGTAIVLIAGTNPSAALLLTPAFALFVGFYLVLFGFLKVGKYATYISEPVMTGYITGMGISVMLGQLLKMLGLSSAGTDVFANISILFKQFNEINIVSAILSFLTLGIILFVKRRWSAFPITLFVLVAGMMAVSVFNLDSHGVKIVGEIPQGLPNLTIPNLRGLPILEIAGFALVIAIVVFSDSLLTAKSFALRGKYPLDENQELVAFGFSSFGSAFVGGPPTSASVSRTAMNEQYKGKTQLVSIIASVIIALVLVLFSPLLYFLPQPVLGAIVFSALINLIDIRAALDLKGKEMGEFIVFITAILGVMVVGVVFGILVAVILSFIEYARKAASPPHTVRMQKGEIIYRFSAALYFANINIFTSRTLDLIKKTKPKVKKLTIDASGIADIDVTAASQLREWANELKSLKVEYYFVNTLPSFREAVKRHELQDVIPAKRLLKKLKI